MEDRTVAESVPLRVYWSDRLEMLADRMFAAWEMMPVGDPFARMCVIVGDISTRNWLQRRFLLHRKPGVRRILANIDFKPIAEFVNDWLAAQTHGSDGAHRRPAEHPCSKGVLAWRIDAVLKAEADNPDLVVLQKYIAHANGRVADRRRFELASRLAELFDDYLANRYRMLADWESGKMPPGDERWQAALYRLLVQESPDTYTRDYARALAADADPSVALRNGFPDYAAIHVFDVAAAPWPYLLMLKKMSGVIPTTFWTFNPSRTYWLDDSGRRETQREKARSLREALQRGETLSETEPKYRLDTPDSRLLGALAGGTRGVLSAELDLAEGDCEWVGDEGADDFASLARLTPEVHVCHSPRRELEVARDALHRFFSETPDARPSDALVLCADWGAYSPLIESVFGADGAGGLPFALDSGVREETPISHSLGVLFEFRTNRFEVNAVFALLGVPAIRERFGIDADGLSILREMVRSNNIHWGYDDEDVNDILGAAKEEESYPFTWRRGLDRFIADALLGPRTDAKALVDAGRLGRLLPCGNVEAERARLVGSLENFVNALAQLRSFLKAPHPIEEWRDRLLCAIDEFYRDADAVSDELAGLRRAVVSAADEALVARAVGKSACRNDPVPGDVMCAAVLGAVSHCKRRVSSPGDAVCFAPLVNGTAVPARFIWICGLNNGTFPRTERRASFDLVGRHPTFFDVTSRDKDASALLKAALGARDRLSLSYIGRDICSNEEVPEAVPLIDLIEWFKGTGCEVKICHHPLQAYSPRYFTEKSDLPPSYSVANYDVAVAILKRQSAAGMDGVRVTPFSPAESGETVIDLDDLVEFCSRPNNFLAKKVLGIRIANPKYDQLSDDDAVGASVDDDFRDAVILGRKPLDGSSRKAETERMVETGLAADADQARGVLETQLSEEMIDEFRRRVIGFANNSEEQRKFGCPGNPVVQELLRFENAEPVVFSVAVSLEDRTTAKGQEEVKNHKVVVVGCHRPAVRLVNGAGEEIPYAFEYRRKFWSSDMIASWIRHLVRQVESCEGGCATALVSPEWKQVRILCPVPAAEARRRITNIVAFATSSMPVDLKKISCKDELPEELAAAVDSSEYFRFKGQRGK